MKKSGFNIRRIKKLVSKERKKRISAIKCRLNKEGPFDPRLAIEDGKSYSSRFLEKMRPGMTIDRWRILEDVLGELEGPCGLCTAAIFCNKYRIDLGTLTSENVDLLEHYIDQLNEDIYKTWKEHSEQLESIDLSPKQKKQWRERFFKFLRHFAVTVIGGVIVEVTLALI